MHLSQVVKLYCRSIYGPRAAFQAVDLLRFIYLLYNVQRMSRFGIGKKLGIGEGSVRTLIGVFRRNKLVKVTRAGCVLTSFGKKIAMELFKEIEVIGLLPKSRASFNFSSFGIVVKNVVAVPSGIVQRDQALLSGALGATMLIFRGKLCFPDFSSASSFVEPFLEKAILKKCHLKNGDVVLLCFGKGQLEMERGAWNAVISFELL